MTSQMTVENNGSEHGGKSPESCSAEKVDVPEIYLNHSDIKVER